MSDFEKNYGGNSSPIFSDDEYSGYQNIDYVDTASDSAAEIKRERKYVSSVFWKFLISCLSLFVIYIPIDIVAKLVNPSIIDTTLYQMIANDLCIGFSILLFWILNYKHPVTKPTPVDKLGVSEFIQFLCISVFLMYTGSIVSELITSLAELFTGVKAANDIEELVNDMPMWQTILFVVILAPIIEEIFMRKLFLGYLLRYGTGFAIVVSGVVFGLFHENFYQFFYASSLGILLGYIYCTYGKLIYTIIFHAVFNILGSVVPLYMVDFLESENMFLLSGALMFSLWLVVAFVGGLLFLIRLVKNRKMYYVEGVLVSPYKTLALNAGFIAYLIYAVAMMILSLFATA